MTVAVRRRARPVAIQRCVRLAQGGGTMVHHRSTVARAPRGRYHNASTDWLGRHQAGPSFVFCRLSLMFAGAYLLGFGRAISLKEPPLRFEGALCRFGFFAGEGASSNIVVLRRDIAQVIR